MRALGLWCSSGAELNGGLLETQEGQQGTLIGWEPHQRTRPILSDVPSCHLLSRLSLVVTDYSCSGTACWPAALPLEATIC